MVQNLGKFFLLFIFPKNLAVKIFKTFRKKNFFCSKLYQKIPQVGGLPALKRWGGICTQQAHRGSSKHFVKIPDLPANEKNKGEGTLKEKCVSTWFSLPAIFSKTPKVFLDSCYF